MPGPDPLGPHTPDAAVSAAYGSAGERCMAISVVLAADTVADALVESMALFPDGITIHPGGSYVLRLVGRWDDGVISNITGAYSSSDESIATVDKDCVVTAHAAGSPCAEKASGAHFEDAQCTLYVSKMTMLHERGAGVRKVQLSAPPPVLKK